jgi:hypothetical protein
MRYAQWRVARCLPVPMPPSSDSKRFSPESLIPRGSRCLCSNATRHVDLPAFCS